MYINRLPNEYGNHGNVLSNGTESMVVLPDTLIDEYVKTKGFAILTIENNIVIDIEVNQEALDAYEESLPEPEPEPEPITQAEIEEMLLDQEYRILLLEYGLEDEEVW